MSDLIIRPGERGQVRLFLIPEEMAKDLEDGVAPLETALGGVALNPVDVQVVPIKSLGEMTVREFLSEAYDVDPDTLPRLLDEAEGHMAILRSGAFPTGGATLAPGENLGFLGLYTERGAPPPSQAALDALRSEPESVDLTPDAPIEPHEPANLGSIFVFAALFGVGLLLMALMIWSVLT